MRRATATLSYHDSERQRAFLLWQERALVRPPVRPSVRPLARAVVEGGRRREPRSVLSPRAHDASKEDLVVLPVHSFDRGKRD